MAITDLPLVSMLRTSLAWHQARQKVLAENVANADTPGFQPKDLVMPAAPGAAAAASSLQVERTNPLHLASASFEAGPQTKAAGRFETRPSGNAVNLEDEMMKVAQNQSDYQLAASLYEKSLAMLRTAVGGKG